MNDYKSGSQWLALHVGRWNGIFQEYEGSSFHQGLDLKSQKRSIITQPELGSLQQTNMTRQGLGVL
ncbi:MAG: hypothetical protein ACFCU9_05125, partial [Cyanophyceae cyanobacterium]